MKRLSWKYVAGLIDGEGCIDVQVTKGVYVGPRVRVNMSIVARDILELLKNNYGGRLEYRVSKNPDNWSDSITWSLNGYKESCCFLRNIVNHLILKKEQARLALWMESHIKGQHVSTEVRDTIREEFKLLKRDSHRLSEKAQENILGCDSRAI
jgi:hypothetical protein